MFQVYTDRYGRLIQIDTITSTSSFWVPLRGKTEMLSNVYLTSIKLSRNDILLIESPNLITKNTHPELFI